MKNIPRVIAALHLPRLLLGDTVSRARLEDYTIKNMEQFVKGGIPGVILQDKSVSHAEARPETIAIMSALGRLVRYEFPNTELGIIIEANDPVAPLAVAQACGASFVRIKVFAGAMLKSSGLQQAVGAQATNYRNSIGSNHIKILADVHDRTGYPLLDVPITVAAQWVLNAGADALILTGSSFDESISYLQNVRSKGITKPLIMGGSATAENVHIVLKYADSVIVSSSLKRENGNNNDLLQWDIEKIKHFMEVVNRIELGIPK
jgi:uncharacterized protein